MNEQSPMADGDNLHASAVTLTGRGVVILGESGWGKSALAIELVRRSASAGCPARLVADDRIIAWRRNGRLLVRPPSALAGMVEVRGFGVRAYAYEAVAVIDLAVVLSEPQTAPRHRSDAVTTICGIELPCLKLSRNNTAGAAEAVEAWMAETPG